MKFQQNGFVVVKSAVNKKIAELLADYIHLKASTKPNIKRHVDALANVHREYADPMMEVLLSKLTPLVEQATSLSLWPSLSFSYHYTTGNQLLKHKDRDSCEIVASLYLGADAEFYTEYQNWPLHLEIKNKNIATTLDVGDVVIFRGNSTPHWRTIFPGKWFVSAIFGYVEKNGKNAYLKYDQRTNLGKPHIGMCRWFIGYWKNNLQHKVLKL